MTGQIHDKLKLKRKQYELIGIDGGPLFEPRDYGLIPTMMHTACYRGYYCNYQLKYRRLYLVNLVICCEAEQYPPLASVEPVLDWEAGAAAYRQLSIPIPFSGTLRIGADFRRSEYIHMGFQKWSAYDKVLDLSFRHGELIGTADLSDELALKPKSFKDEYNEKDFIRRIDDAFSLDLDTEE